MIQLRPYQRANALRAASIVDEQGIAYLSMEVRTGKTHTALEVVRILGAARVLFVTKKKAIPSVSADVHAVKLDHVVTVTNFEQVAKYPPGMFDLLIVDEAHGIGAYPKPSKRLKDLHALGASRFLLLSGTPSPESFSQLFHQFALHGGLWGRNFYRWADKYVDVQNKRVAYGKSVRDYSSARADMVLRDVAPYMVTTSQADAGFTQTIVERVHRVPMKARTYRLLRRIMADGVIGSPSCRSVLADTGAKVMSKLHQISSGTVITEAHGAVIFDRSKVEYIRRTFEGRKIAVLYKFDAEGRMLREGLSNVANTPEAFNADPTATFVGQVQSSREGVNLSTASAIVMLSIDYSALSYLQGRDRASYLGRDTPPEVHWIFAERSIEPKIYATVTAKESYTVTHYRHDRGELSKQADQGIRGGRLVCPEANADEQERDPRPTLLAS